MTIDVLKTLFEKLGLAFFTDGAYNLNLIGLRSSQSYANLFDDTFLVAYKDESGTWHMESWPCTTDPGRPWLQDPGRKAGCAILKEGQYKGSHEIGLHKGKPALVQRKPLPVYRDSDKDLVLDMDDSTVEWGIFGINIHRAGKDSPLVELWSAGCQVAKREKDHLRLMELANLQQKHHPTWKTYTYTLVDTRRAPELVPFLLLT